MILKVERIGKKEETSERRGAGTSCRLWEHPEGAWPQAAVQAPRRWATVCLVMLADSQLLWLSRKQKIQRLSCQEDLLCPGLCPVMRER